MKWRVRKPGAILRSLTRWHKWFAWFPVRVPTKGRMSGQTKVWLETIERRSKWMGDPSFGWDYRVIDKDIH